MDLRFTVRIFRIQQRAYQLFSVNSGLESIYNFLSYQMCKDRNYHAGQSLLLSDYEIEELFQYYVCNKGPRSC